MFKELLADTSPAILSLFKLGYPVIDRRVQFGEGFLLLEYRFVGEAGYAGRAEVGADSIVEVAAARAQRTMSFAEILTAFIEATEFLVFFSM